MGIEPMCAGATIRCVNRFATPTISGAPEGIRTPGTRLRRPLLYPAELLAQYWYIINHFSLFCKCFA